MLTGRFALLLLVAAPLVAADAWVPGLAVVGLVYAVLIGVVALVDWRLGPADAFFTLEREHDARLSLGVDNRVQVHVRTRAARAVAFQVRDEPPPTFGLDVRVLAGVVAAHAPVTLSYHVRPPRRGNYHFGDFTLRWKCPLGLVVRQKRYAAAGEVRVYPNLLDVRKYDLLLKRNQLFEMGLRRTRLRGQGAEFERLREYQADDPYRRIDWAATARRGKPIVREFETERSQSVITVLDVGRMMQSPVGPMAKLDYAINAALLLGYVATGKGDKVGLLAFADEVQRFSAPRQGRGQFYQMLEALYALEPQPVEPNFARGIGYLALKVRKRALIVIFTDLTGGIGLQALVAQVGALRPRHLPLVVTISDPGVVALAHHASQGIGDVYARAAAEQLLDERQTVLEGLRRRGVLTLDVPAASLSIDVVQRYLDLKGRQML